MFKQETETIIKAITQRIGQSPGDVVAIKDILAADIPHPVKIFFRADIEAMLLSELQRHRKSSRFNFAHHEVQSLQQQINSILVLSYTLSRKEFEQRLVDAVHMMINYLIRPQWTLTSILFEKDQNISWQALISLLRYFGPYEYLRDIITHYLKEKQTASISKEEFKSLVWRVDGEYIKRKSGNELARVMSPIYDFLDYQNKTGNNSILIKALIRFFEDKGLAMVLPRLEGEIAQGKTGLTQRELGELLEDVRRTLGAFTVEKLEVEHKDLIERHADGYHESKSEHEQPISKLDFGTAISEIDKRKFIRKIFRHDEQAYSSELKSLSGITTWKQASKFIDEIFIKHDVDPYSSEATRFIEVIFEQYHPKSK